MASRKDPPTGLIGALSDFAGSLAQVVGVAVFTCILLLLAIIVLPDLVGSPLTLSSRFIFLVLLYGAYTLVVRPLAIPRIRRLRTALERRSLHHYTLTPSGLVIEYRTTDLSGPEKKYRFTVSFDEVTDLRLLTPSEAYSLASTIGNRYRRHRLEEDRQLRMFRIGEIPCPSLILHPSSEYLSLFLEGSGFTYIMAFDHDNPTDVVRAFRASRTGGGAPSPAPEE